MTSRTEFIVSLFDAFTDNVRPTFRATSYEEAYNNAVQDMCYSLKNSLCNRMDIVEIRNMIKKEIRLGMIVVMKGEV